MRYLDQFREEYRHGRVTLALTQEGYKHKIGDLYPDAEIVWDALVHVAWVGMALFMISNTPNMSPPEMVIKMMLSLGGMVLALFAGRLLPFSFALSGGALFLGMLALPHHVVAGPLGMYGLHALSRRFRKWYRRNLVKRWCLRTEEQFIHAVRERIIVITAKQTATEETKRFLERLAEIGGGDRRRESRGTTPHRDRMILAFLLVLLSGCQQTGYFTITGLDSELRPRFCVSEEPGCSGMGVNLECVAVEEVPVAGTDEKRRMVWAIHATTDEPLRLLVYGGTPPGWVQDIPPDRLRVGPTYEVGQLRFRLKQEGEEVKYEVVR